VTNITKQPAAISLRAKSLLNYQKQRKTATLLAACVAAVLLLRQNKRLPRVSSVQAKLSQAVIVSERPQMQMEGVISIDIEFEILIGFKMNMH
jgi:hypothetical protein